MEVINAVLFIAFMASYLMYERNVINSIEEPKRTLKNILRSRTVEISKSVELTEKYNKAWHFWKLLWLPLFAAFNMLFGVYLLEIFPNVLTIVSWILFYASLFIIGHTGMTNLNRGDNFFFGNIKVSAEFTDILDRWYVKFPLLILSIVGLVLT